MLYIAAMCHHFMFSIKLTTNGRTTSPSTGSTIPIMWSIVMGDFRFCA